MLADTLLFSDLFIVSIAEPLKNGIGYKSALGFQLEKSANQLELFDDMNFTDEATLGPPDGDSRACLPARKVGTIHAVSVLEREETTPHKARLYLQSFFSLPGSQINIFSANVFSPAAYHKPL